MESVWAILDRNQICKAEFAPYWRQKQITSNDPKVLVSYYSWKNERRRLILLGNWDSKPKAVTLRFTDLDPKQYTATDEETGAAADLTNPIPFPVMILGSIDALGCHPQKRTTGGSGQP